MRGPVKTSVTDPTMPDISVSSSTGLGRSVPMADEQRPYSDIERT
jgi:hypothetical protein